MRLHGRTVGVLTRIASAGDDGVPASTIGPVTRMELIELGLIGRAPTASSGPGMWRVTPAGRVVVDEAREAVS